MRTRLGRNSRVLAALSVVPVGGSRAVVSDSTAAAPDQLRLQGLEGSAAQARGTPRIPDVPGDDTSTDTGTSTPRKDGALPESGGKPSSEETRKNPGERPGLLARRALDVIFGKGWSAALARDLLSVLAAPFTLPDADDLPGAGKDQEQPGIPEGEGRLPRGSPSESEAVPDAVWCSPAGVLGGALLAAAVLPAVWSSTKRRPTRANGDPGLSL